MVSWKNSQWLILQSTCYHICSSKKLVNKLVYQRFKSLATFFSHNFFNLCSKSSWYNYTLQKNRCHWNWPW